MVEYWKYGNGLYKVFSENIQFLKGMLKIKEDINIGARYFNSKLRPLAMDVIIPEKKLSFILQQAKNMNIKIAKI